MQNQEFYLDCVNFKMIIKTSPDLYPARCWIYKTGVLGNVSILRFSCGNHCKQVLFKVIGLINVTERPQGHLVVEKEKESAKETDMRQLTMQVHCVTKL